ncbi:Oligosaccharide biosynthesis protein Alg14 [Halomonas sp. GFAJ-1]|uniref:Oligosaccharide biosynthesis protein Alg14 n=1 Tax=Halomonas sp. GFAJ-1 TaxID=1118153 RepID=UPI00023A41C9|nr:Oligosaccharide biosynthesis protein Alg14 [Halomonas sp. GFAJ-1]AVI62905.1 oligosaccharide biosynthesis protein Alg14 [Halomonas sp. GFAJ-1]EHK62026.1 oligosaccharide biosynthesis protein alg14 like protein [Halomonas sp. GFAJ-1]
MKILLVGSFGGHFIQLKRLYGQIVENVDQNSVSFTFASTEQGLIVNEAPTLFCPNIHRGSRIKDLISAVRRTYAVLKIAKPDTVISTGALPGLLLCFIAKLMGKQVIWVDSMANYQQLSFSGKLARFFCDICLTQWEHLAANDKRVSYWGKVL